ncbi:IS3 family transposase [uncultured Anaerococcus sp.]|uniref:IS3 family transposase n=1 Tax=uncultured Anaerococcus sp. TaxID=293428 RepID=UPI003423EA9A
MKWYNEDRIKTKLNGMSAIEYRLHSDLNIIKLFRVYGFSSFICFIFLWIC